MNSVAGYIKKLKWKYKIELGPYAPFPELPSQKIHLILSYISRCPCLLYKICHYITSPCIILASLSTILLLPHVHSYYSLFLSLSLPPPSTPLVHTSVTGLSERLFPCKSLSIIQLNVFLWSLSTANN